MQLYQSHLVLSFVLLLLVNSVSGIFYKGCDMSQLPAYDCSGTCSPYRNNASAPTEDALRILKDNNVNTVRLRVWNNPSRPNSYCDLDGVLKMAKRATTAGLLIHLDFHYADIWADPSHQPKPAAWARLGLDDLAKAVYNYSFVVVDSLNKQGTPPASVQVGNEIDNGFMWPVQGQACADSGSLSCSSDNWASFSKLLANGVQGVKDAMKSNPPKIMIHIAKMNGGNAANVVSWFTQLNKYNVPFDIIGLSFYPVWNCGGIKAVPTLKAVHDAFPDKEIVIAETNYPFWNVNCNQCNEYPMTYQGQEGWLAGLIKAMEALPGGNGVYWWGTEYYQNPAAGVNFALWDQQGVGVPALHQGWH